jgi:hypothetical protein
MKPVQLLGNADVLALIALACGACGLRPPAALAVACRVLRAVRRARGKPGCRL